MSTFNRNWLWIPGVLVLGAVFWYFSDILSYLLVAWVLSMLGKPLMVFFVRRLRIGRFRVGMGGAAMLTIMTFYAVLAGLVMVFVPTIVAQARQLAGVDYQALGEKLRVPFASLDLQLHQAGLLKSGESLGVRIQESLSVWFKPALVGDFVGQFIGTAGNIVVAVASITFILFFFLKENRLFLDILHALVPNDLEAKVRHALEESSEVLTRYFGGLFIQTLCFSGVATILLWILGVENALLIGVFGGIFNIIPYVGPIIGMIFGLFITVTGHVDGDLALMWPLLLKVAGAFMVTQFLDNMVISTIIFSKSVQAHPLEIFLVTMIAAKVGGVTGMVIGIPVYTVLRVIARVFFSEFKIVQRLTDHLDEEDPPVPAN
ncbi:MAG: AI-2E family transporter [Chitinophagales bacterium]|nr:AI-2E family transporter [Chitinophagales bacterium]